MSSWFDESNTRFKCAATDWQEAVRCAGRLLTERGSVDAGYTDAMISCVEEFGAYIVIAPGVALAHARPDASVKRNDLVLVTLAEPVEFGNEDNDPVSLVFAFCAQSSNGHLEQLQALAEALSDEAWVEKVKKASSIQDIS